MSDLSRIFKAYDIRGLVPQELDAAAAMAIGSAFAQLMQSPKIVIGHDMRASSPELAKAFADGANRVGVDVVSIGLASTDQLYFASGQLNIPGAMFTASHNPAAYNGIKMCRAQAAPIGSDTGLSEIQRLAGENNFIPASQPGTTTVQDVLADYADYLTKLVDLSAIKPLTVVVDAGNGMGGHTVPAVLSDLPLNVIPLYFELDGNFPNHEANPLDPKNLVDLQAAVRTSGADIGLAFDGDADRCFAVDEKGDIVPPSAITALVAERELAKAPGSTIIYNLITSHAVPELVTAQGGVPVRSRVGHSYIKAEMARTNAIFGGEHSAHYYFRDFWKADTGMLAALHVLSALGTFDGPLSNLVAKYQPYFASGEINSTVTDQQQKMNEVEGLYKDQPGVVIDHLDGLSVDFGDGSWFNIRSSNTEPLLRLNVEAATHERMQQLRDDVLAVIR